MKRDEKSKSKNDDQTENVKQPESHTYFICWRGRTFKTKCAKQADAHAEFLKKMNKFI